MRHNGPENRSCLDQKEKKKPFMDVPNMNHCRAGCQTALSCVAKRAPQSTAVEEEEEEEEEGEAEGG